MKKWIALVVVVGLVGAFFAFDLGAYLTLAYFQSVRAELLDFVAANPIVSRVGYFVIYVFVTALSLPGAAIMTLAGGAVFGLAWGFVLVSFASSIGATCAFIVARTLLGEWVQSRFAAELAGVNEGLEKDGSFYLFGLRMVPLVPFFVVNLVLGLSKMRVGVFYLVSQVGMLPGTLVFVFAGSELGQIADAGDVLSPTLIAAFTLLGIFPLIAKKIMGVLKSRRGDGG